MAQKAVHADSVYDVIELIGTSTVSWEDAAKNVVEEAAKHLRDLRIAEVVEEGPGYPRWQSRGLPRQAQALLQISKRPLIWCVAELAETLC